jgi:enamine deaminase RidA (YjgF/YER057c/UK114 family)
MRASFAVLLFGVVLLLAAAPAGAQKHKPDEEPKPQILPLPPEPPMALAADTGSLDFHISPLSNSGGLSAQIRQSLNNLIRDTHGETIVKLRAFVAGTGDARRVQAAVAELFTEHKLPLPVLSILQVGALGAPGEQVVIEAVVSTHKVVNPSGLGFFFGQSGPSLEAALQRVKASADAAAVPGDHILSLTCFTSQIEDFRATGKSVRALFPNTAVNIVQSVRDPASDFTLCEAVGQLVSPPKTTIEHLGTVNATLVNSPQLVFTGLQLSFGSYLDDAHEAFDRLQRAARALGSDETPVEVDGFSLDRYAASALRRTNSLAPGVFTVQTIEGFSAIDATGGLEAILAAGVNKTASSSQLRRR